MGSQGEVYIAGGYGSSKGMEVWNPATGTVELISNELPPEVGSAGVVLEFILFPRIRVLR
jgi:hypothetical protein